MSFPRIDRAEIVSFRLTLPLSAVEQLPDQLPDLELALAPRPGAICLESPREGPSLTFRPKGARAELVSMVLGADDQGRFFRRVLVPLMVRYQGDLHVRLDWRAPGDPGPATTIEVKMKRGTVPASLENVVDLLRAATQPLFPAAGTPRADTGEYAEAQEIESLLEQARSAFAEYRRRSGAQRRG